MQDSQTRQLLFQQTSSVDVAFATVASSCAVSADNLWILFKETVPREGYVYDVITTESSWQDAESYCEDNGGYLASITSQEEHDFLVTFTTEEYTNARSDRKMRHSQQKLIDVVLTSESLFHDYDVVKNVCCYS